MKEKHLKGNQSGEFKETPISEPTSLNLFAFHGDRLSQVRQFTNNASIFENEFNTANFAYKKLEKATIERSEKVTSFRKDIEKEFQEIRSSRTASAAYLTIIDELSPQGLSPSEIFDFYLLCLTINTAWTKSDIKESIKRSPSVAMEKVLIEDKKKNPRERILQEKLGKPPSWFKGIKQQWEFFLADHANFSAYLNPDLIELNVSEYQKRMIDRPGMTLQDSLPDWLTENGGTIPDRKKVEEELLEDTETDKQISEQFKSTIEQVSNLNQLREQRFRKAAYYIEQRRRELVGSMRDFPSLISFLKATEQVHEYPTDYDSFMRLSLKDLVWLRIPKEKSREKAILKFSNSEKAFSKETIALFLEQKLIKADIIKSAQDPVDENLINIFENLILTSTEKSERTEISGLKDKDKKSSKIVDSEIKPILRFFSENELLYIYELIRSLQRQPIEELIFEIADLSARRIIETKDVTDKQQKSVMSEIRKFTASWVRSHWKRAYEKLNSSISEEEKTEGKEVSTSNHVVFAPETEKLAPEIEEIGESIAEAEQGNLSGWKLYYAIKRERLEKAEKIKGEDLSERKKELDRFLCDNGISCSIGSDSVIEAFNWLVTVPKEVEWMRIRKEIGGEVFKKLKRGAVRIFYKTDEDKKEIFFFVHQKKAWKYGF